MPASFSGVILRMCVTPQASSFDLDLASPLDPRYSPCRFCEVGIGSVWQIKLIEPMLLKTAAGTELLMAEWWRMETMETECAMRWGQCTCLACPEWPLFRLKHDHQIYLTVMVFSWVWWWGIFRRLHYCIWICILRSSLLPSSRALELESS